MLRYLLAGTVVLGVSLTTPVYAAGFNVTDVWRASPDDLNAALADATAQNDQFAVQCYSGVIAYNAANPPAAFGGNIVGVVSGFQAARDTVKEINSNGEDFIPAALVSACGPLALDAEHDIGHASLMLFGLKLL